MQEDKFTSYKHYLLDFLFYRDTDQSKNTHTDQKTNAHTDAYTISFSYFFLIETNDKLSKVATLKNVFIHCVDNVTRLFFMKVYCYIDIFSTGILLLSLKQVL